jgi:hypothetical protein
MKLDRLAVLFPFYSIIPVSLGLIAVWIFFTVFSILRFINCPAWENLSPAPVNTIQIVSYTNDILFVKTDGGKIYCNKGSEWQICSLPTYPSSNENAPKWLRNYSDIILQKQISIKVLTRINGYADTTYLALSNQNEIWQCSTTFVSEVNEIVYSWKVLLLIIPVMLGLFSIWWFFKILIEEGYPVIWDWWGKGKRIK